MTEQQAMRMALEYVESVPDDRYNAEHIDRDALITALRQALEQESDNEPVAWMVYTQDGQSVYVTDNPTDIQEGQRALPMYIRPPQRKPLTDKELNVIGTQWHFNLLEDKDKADLFAFARAIEAAHGIKENT